MAAVGGFPGQDHTHELNVYLGAHAAPAAGRVVIYDPAGTAEVDVTGWDLDLLRDHLATLAADHAVGSEREITEDELDALTLEGWTHSLSAHGHGRYGVWHVSDDQVQQVAARMRQLVDEAIYQRDLPAALAALAAGTSLTYAQRAAYDEYVRGLS